MKNEIAVLDTATLTSFTTTFPDAPTPDEKILLNAYLVIAHACIEEHLESLFLDFASAIVKFRSTGINCEIVAGAMIAWKSVIESLDYRTRTLDDSVKGGLGVVKKAVANNHGIKESNVQNLARSVGIEWPSFEASCNTAFTKLDTLGGKRGDVAHVSTLRSMSAAVYSDDARAWVADALSAAEDIERYLASLR